MPALLEATAVRKTFAGVQALRGVSFDLVAGEVHALVGENGAGKSTLIRIFTGAETADSGTLAIGGQVVPNMAPDTSRELGIAAVYQQPALFPQLTVAENIALALERGRRWRPIDWSTRRRIAAQLVARVGSSIDPLRLVETLSMPEQQVVEIAKAIGARAKILIMDEPTASLTDREVDRLLQAVRRLRDEGVGIIFISHRLEEVFAIADRITVLRDGETVATQQTNDVDRDELIRLMVGRTLTSVFPKRSVAHGNVALELRNLGNRSRGVCNVSLSIKRGEILGVAGLVGAGRTELAETVFGLTPADSGQILLRGSAVRIDSPAEAVRLGIGYVPEDRRHHGVVLDMSIAANTSMARLAAVSRHGLIDRRAEEQAAAGHATRLRVKATSMSDDVRTLSGGNQQKVALARWLATEPDVLILDEPTQGVDVGSKAEIHGIMQTLAERGLAIMMISSELPEILGMSDRIAVMRAGRLVGVLSADDATPQNVLTLALVPHPSSAGDSAPAAE